MAPDTSDLPPLPPRVASSLVRRLAPHTRRPARPSWGPRGPKPHRARPRRRVRPPAAASFRPGDRSRRAPLDAGRPEPRLAARSRAPPPSLAASPPRGRVRRPAALPPLLAGKPPTYLPDELAGLASVGVRQI